MSTRKASLSQLSSGNFNFFAPRYSLARTRMKYQNTGYKFVEWGLILNPFRIDYLLKN